MVEKVRNLDLFLLGLSNLIRLSVSENMIIILVFFVWFYLNKYAFFFLLYPGSPSLHNPGFQSQKNLPQMDEALVFHLLHRPNFPTLTSTPQKNPKTFGKKNPMWPFP